MTATPFGATRPLPVLDHQASAETSSAQPWIGDEEISPPSIHALTEGERARTVIGASCTGVLVMNVASIAAPIGLVVPYVTGNDGMPLIGLRTGLHKTTNLPVGLPASLAVAETPLTSGSGTACGGVTLLGTFDAIGADELEDALHEYGRENPSDAALVRRGASVLHRLEVEELLVALGTGAVVRIAVEDYLQASADPLASVAPGLAAHLSSDDADTLVLLCRAFGNEPDTRTAILSGIDQHGMDLVATTSQGRNNVRICFGTPLTNPEEVRRELSLLAKGARFKLGVG